MISFRKMCMSYPDSEAPVFTDFTEHIGRGEFVLVSGRSGSGKTTLIHLLIRELTGYTGSIKVDGEELSSIRPAGISEYRRKLGVVFQDAKLFDGYTVYDNLELAMSMTKGRRADTDHRIRNVLKMMDAEHLYRRYPEELSGGETQRVCMARALLNYPKVLLADEPTGNLDPEASKEIFRLLEIIHRQGTTVILATHDHETAERIRATHRVIDLEPQRKQAVVDSLFQTDHKKQLIHSEPGGSVNRKRKETGA